MALVDQNPQFVAQACKRIRSYLEEIRTSIESSENGPIITFDFDALGQLLMPHKRRSNQAGILWHGVVTARHLRQMGLGLKAEGDKNPAVSLQKFQIPEGTKYELRHFCRKLLREYKDIVESSTAHKLGTEPEDMERLLADDTISDDELGRVVRRFGSVDLSLKLLDSLLATDMEFSQPRYGDDVRFNDYLSRIEMERPEPNKSLNNRNDALNLAQTADLRSSGREAYLVTTTRAVRDSEDRITREPFYFALSLAVRYKFREVSREACTTQLDLMISRLTQVIRHTIQFDNLVSTFKAGDQTHRQETTLLRNALSELGNDPALKQLTNLLSEAATAVRSGQERPVVASADHPLDRDIATFNKFRSLVNRLRENLGDVPEVTLKRKRLSSEHFSYSLLDHQGKMLFAADLYGDNLAIAWTTETTFSEFCSYVTAYYAHIEKPSAVQVLTRLAGLSKPRTFPVTSLASLKETVSCEIGEFKPSLIKVVCDQNIFWYDSSALYAFDHPEETLHFEAAKVAVSIYHKDQLSQLTDFFLATSTEYWPRANAQTNLGKLLRMEEK